MTFEFHDDQVQHIQYNRRLWVWPAYDTELRKVVDTVHDVNAALVELARLGKKTRTAVQAGGACGVWPERLAEDFDLVVTFEPHPLNFHCLSENVTRGNVVAINAALGKEEAHVMLDLAATEANNAGAWFTREGEGGVRQLTLDATLEEIIPGDLPLDLICLDVEGRELDALKGGQMMIAAHRPVVMLEQKNLPQVGLADNSPIRGRAHDAQKWLVQEMNYRVARSIHRDVVLVPND